MLLWLSSLVSPLVGNIHLIIIFLWNVSTKGKKQSQRGINQMWQACWHNLIMEWDNGGQYEQ